MRKSSRVADDPSVPDWPVEQACPCCGKPCYMVENEAGDDVLIDAQPMDTELVTELYGEVRRVRAVNSYNHPDVFRRGIGGWRLLDPVRVIGPDGGWFWYASRVRLTVDNAEALYSEHVYVCKRVSHKVIEGLLSQVSFTGGAAADIYGTRAKKVAAKERCAEWNELTRQGYAPELPSESGKSLEAATQLGLFC